MDRDYAARYGSIEEWHWWFRGRQRILEDVLRRELPARRSRTMCVIGCGPAQGFAWLGAFTGDGGRVIGVDVEVAHAQAANGRATYVVGSMEAVPLASGSVDAVLAFDVLEHVDDETAALREAARLLAPGGVLVATVPAMPSLWGQQDTISQHRRRYTRATLRDAFRRAGLARPRLSYFNTLLLPAVAGVRWTRRALGLAERMQTDFDDNRPGLVNDALMELFAAERHVLRHAALPIGVSLLAVWRQPA